jgi:hypothetical protein
VRVRPSASLVRLVVGALVVGALVSSAHPSATGSGPALAVEPQGAQLSHVAGTSCTVFPANSYWHTDVRSLPVDRRSKAWMKSIGSATLHPDFGPAGKGQVPYGIPVTVVSGSHADVSVRFAYADESDRVAYPLGRDTRIEGGSHADGDRHALIVDKSTCRVYELFDVRKVGSRWTAGSGATWSLRSNALRPAGWTSADAAGLSILAGLLRYDEVEAGHVDHAIRFTAPVSARGYLWPARHQAGARSTAAYPPMGARFRLKKSFSTKGYSKDAKVVVAAMKTYGLVLADNGSRWFFTGESDSRWSDRMISDLKRIPSSAFEAVDTGRLSHTRNSARVG